MYLEDLLLLQVKIYVQEASLLQLVRTIKLFYQLRITWESLSSSRLGDWTPQTRPEQWAHWSTQPRTVPEPIAGLGILSRSATFTSAPIHWLDRLKTLGSAETTLEGCWFWSGQLHQTRHQEWQDVDPADEREGAWGAVASERTAE